MFLEIIFNGHIFVSCLLTPLHGKHFYGSCNVAIFQPSLCIVHEISVQPDLGCTVMSQHVYRTPLTVQWDCISVHMQYSVCIVSPLQKHRVMHSGCAAMDNGPNLSKGRPRRPVRAMEFYLMCVSFWKQAAGLGTREKHAPYSANCTKDCVYSCYVSLYTQLLIHNIMIIHNECKCKAI